MKRLFTTTALVASMAFASAAYAASDDMQNTSKEVTPAEQQDTQAATETPEELLTGSLNESADVLTIDGEAAIMSATAISARDVIGASVVGPDGEEVGVVDDLALAEDRSIEQIGSQPRQTGVGREGGLSQELAPIRSRTHYPLRPVRPDGEHKNRTPGRLPPGRRRAHPPVHPQVGS